MESFKKPSLHKASLRLSPAWQRAPPPLGATLSVLPSCCVWCCYLLVTNTPGAYFMANAAPSFKISVAFHWVVNPNLKLGFQ